MKKMKTFLFILALMSLFLAPKAYADLVYVEGLNDTFEASENVYHTGAAESSYGWTPENSFDLAKIEIYTLENLGYEAEGWFTITFREDDGGLPGDLLQTVTFDLGGESGFYGAEFDSFVSLTAGETYWIGYYHENSLGSHLASGTDTTRLYYYVNDNPGGDPEWRDAFNEGEPTQYGPSALMAKFYAPVPVPAAVWLLGSGLLAIVGIRRRESL
jgi:hypothetical protein